ncbi:MAG: DUF507 family protein [Bdellovibrionaceae bacterium]|nr:DUF507 family protein [Pseudobdellovibrionaceae bacterium]
MSLSEERLSHLAHLVIDGIWNDDLVDYTDDDAAIRAGKRAMAQWAAEESQIDATVRAKVASLKRNVIEGTPEWDVMYSKYYEEEMNRRGQK